MARVLAALVLSLMVAGALGASLKSGGILNGPSSTMDQKRQLLQDGSFEAQARAMANMQQDMARAMYAQQSQMANQQVQMASAMNAASRQSGPGFQGASASIISDGNGKVVDARMAVQSDGKTVQTVVQSAPGTQTKVYSSSSGGSNGNAASKSSGGSSGGGGGQKSSASSTSSKGRHLLGDKAVASAKTADSAKQWGYPGGGSMSSAAAMSSSMGGGGGSMAGSQAYSMSGPGGSSSMAGAMSSSMGGGGMSSAGAMSAAQSGGWGGGYSSSQASAMAMTQGRGGGWGGRRWGGYRGRLL